MAKSKLTLIFPLREPIHRQCEILFKTDDGRPWRLNGMPFFYPIYDQEREKLVLLTSRQSTKTTLLRNFGGLRSVNRRGNSTLYIAPTNNQVGDFSRKKLDRIFDYTPELKAAFVNKSATWNVLLKEFSSTRSTITLRSVGGSNGADRVRGNTANDIQLDELQNILEEDIPVIEECAATFDGLDGRPLASYLYTGTPLSSQNLLQKTYNRSKQYEWHITCPHCRMLNDPLGLEHLDAACPWLMCQRCGRDMNKPRGAPRRFDGSPGRVVPDGIWLPHNERGSYDGYRIVRLMMPWSRWRTKNYDGVLDRYESWPIRRFKNEVMALPHDDGDVPITEEMVKACCHEYDLPIAEDEVRRVAEAHQGYYKFAGLDWAMQAKDDDTASYTIFAIFALVGSKLKLIFAHRFVGIASNDPDHVLNKVREWMRLFDVTMLGADYGIGYKDDYRLQEDFGQNRVAIFHYTGADGANSKTVYDIGGRKWKLPRTRTLDQLCIDIGQGQFILPRYENGRQYTDDWLRLTVEVRKTSRDFRYGHIGPDDFVHVTNYANLAKRLHSREGDFAHGLTTPGWDPKNPNHAGALAEFEAQERAEVYLGDIGVF